MRAWKKRSIKKRLESLKTVSYTTELGKEEEEFE